MKVYIARRILLLVPTVIGVVTLVFFAVRLAPGDPIAFLIPPDLPDTVREEAIDEIRARYGLDKPMYTQYVVYLSRMLRLDFGRSIRTRSLIRDELRTRIPNTLHLGIAAMVLTTILGVTVGVIAGVNRGTWLDSIAMFLALAGVSMPGFWLGLLLMLVFGLYLGVLPPSGFGGSIYTLEGFKYAILPLLTLSRGSAGLARYTRSSMLDVINQDYIRTARSKGLAERTVIYKHGLRNALIPVVTILGLQFGTLLGGTVIIEMVFGWPGIGRYLISGIYGRDYPVVQAGVLMMAISFVLANLVTDLAYGIIDPRIRYD